MIRLRQTNELVLRLNLDERRILVESGTEDGTTSVKEISIQTFLDCIQYSTIYKKGVDSGFLPRNCFHVSIGSGGEKDYCIWHPRLTADISYYGTEYLDFPLPRLVFGVTVSPEGKINRCRLGVAADEPPRESTPMYVYPFSNVTGFDLCMGNNELPTYRNRSTLATLPDFLLRLPNNNDSFWAKNNKLHLQYRDLLEHLKKKDTAYYYTDVLVPNGKTLLDFIKERK